MAVGFVLIKVNTGTELQAYDKLSKVEDIVELYQIFGEYDLIAKILAENFKDIAEIVVHKIRTIDEIKETKTITGFDIY